MGSPFYTFELLDILTVPTSEYHISNQDYPFRTYALIGSTDEILTTKISEDPYYGGTINFGVSMMPLPTVSAESSTSREIITIPYLGYILDPIGAIHNKLD
jgi:hypothetical protein